MDIIQRCIEVRRVREAEQRKKEELEADRERAKAYDRSFDVQAQRDKLSASLAAGMLSQQVGSSQPSPFYDSNSSEPTCLPACRTSSYWTCF